MTFQTSIGDGCLDGTSKPSVKVNLLIKDAKGNIIAKGSTTSFSDGSWQFCNYPGGLQSGWRLQAKVPSTAQTHSATVPPLSVKADRNTNVVSGKSLAATSISIEVVDYRNLSDGNYDQTSSATTNGSGAYSHDFSGDVDILGGTLVWATVDVGADAFTRFTTGQYLGFQFATSTFFGTTRPNRVVGITLSNGGVVATATGVGDSSSFTEGSMVGDLTADEDDPYIVSGGESVSAPDLASDASFTIPAVDGTANASTDIVTGTCFSGMPYEVDALNPSTDVSGFRQGTAGGGGSFSIKMTSAINIKSGSVIDIYCWTSAGDEVTQQFLVP